jgi:hypothetical protein
MIHRTFLAPILALAALALPLALLTANTTAATEPAAFLDPRAPAADDSDFVKDFRKALKQNAATEMQKLVKTRQSEAVAAIIDVGARLASEPAPDVEPLMTAFGEAWSAVYKSEFVAKVTEYFKSLDAAKLSERADLLAHYDKWFALFDGNLEKKVESDFEFAYAKLQDYPEYFEQTGDLYYASQTAYVCARSLDEVLRGAGADQRRAWKNYVKAIAYRDRIELKDAVYEECVRRRNALASKGFDKDKAPPTEPQGGGGAAPSEPTPTPAAGGASVKVPLTFEIVPSVETFQRPNFLADDIIEVWNGVVLDKEKGGNKGTFQQMSVASPVILRVGAADLRVDFDGDGTPDEKIPLTGNVTPVKVTIGSGSDARPWAFLCAPGSDKANFQGIEVNLAPSDSRMTLFTLGAASVVGTLDGVALRLIDETLDGNYGSRPTNMGYEGLTKDYYQPEIDSLVIGSSKHALPFSEFVEVNGKWYRLAVDTTGRDLTAQSIAPKTGFLKLDFKGAGVVPSTLIVQGAAGELEKALFDLAEGGAKGIAVPVGEYKLLFGQLRKGKKKQVQKCLILPGKTTTTWKVRDGETTLVELGAPFNFDFAAKHDGDKITIEGASVRVVGKAAERYERTWNCVPHPEVAWRKKGTKKPSKYERMPIAAGVEILNTKGFGAAWAPLDLVIEAKGAGEGAELQLVEKKHDLFGKIESEWKE